MAHVAIQLFICYIYIYIQITATSYMLKLACGSLKKLGSPLKQSVKITGDAVTLIAYPLKRPRSFGNPIQDILGYACGVTQIILLHAAVA